MGLKVSSLDSPTAQEIDTIRQIWVKVMENPTEHGVLILGTYFGQHPEYLSTFQKFKGIPLEEVTSTPLFRKHATLIINTFDNVIGNIEHPETLETELLRLAKLHKRRNLTDVMFYELRDVILDILEEHFNMDINGRRAWMKVFAIAYHYMLQGMND